MSSEKKEKKQHKMNFNIKEKLKKTFSKEHLKEVFTGEEQKKHLKQGSYSSIMTVIVLAVIVVINLIVAQIPTSKTQIDLSTQKMYSITDETKTALKDLDQDVTLYYIVQKGSEDDTIEKLLEHYDELSDHIKVETKDPDLYPKFTSQYTDQTVAANSVIVVCGDKSKVVSNSDMWETSTNYQTYQTQTTGFDGEGPRCARLDRFAAHLLIAALHVAVRFLAQVRHVIGERDHVAFARQARADGCDGAGAHAGEHHALAERAR